jgi:hypothetical protein
MPRGVYKRKSASKALAKPRQNAVTSLGVEVSTLIQRVASVEERLEASIDALRLVCERIDGTEAFSSDINVTVEKNGTIRINRT